MSKGVIVCFLGGTISIHVQLDFTADGLAIMCARLGVQ